MEVSLQDRKKAKSNSNVSLQDAIWNLKIAVLKFRYFAIRYESTYCEETGIVLPGTQFRAEFCTIFAQPSLKLLFCTIVELFK